MKSESDLRKIVLKMLEPLHAVHVEPSSGTNAGTPDVNCTFGWIELKWLPEWPKRESTVVKPTHFEPEQRNWLRKRCERGGRAFMLLVVGVDHLDEDWMLIWGRVAADNVGVLWTKEDYIYGGYVHNFGAEGRPKSQELVKAITGQWNTTTGEYGKYPVRE